MTYYAHYRNADMDRELAGVIDLEAADDWKETARQLRETLAELYGVEPEHIKILEWAVLQ